jgi:D-tyrosyl-tRNA(Tyr) deacylase
VRAVVQRVASAAVSVEGREVSRIDRGLLVLLGVHESDDEANADRMADKLRALRIFEDDEGRMNLSVGDLDGAILCVSNFTVYGDARRGNRPSFVAAARAEQAEKLYERVRERLAAQGGVFGAHMHVERGNDGPVTLVVDV